VAPRQIDPPYRQLAAKIRERILAGEWVPGEQLPTLRAIKDQYDVSIATARRAMNLLQGEGYVVVSPGWGVFRAEN
jgi:GntR family transcriptional regulator